MTISKTKNYEIFKFRNDNRNALDQKHIMRLKESIKSRNLLHMRPIMVNSDMEIMDGQHRLLAAKGLGVDIYYEVHKELEGDDIIIMNRSKQWQLSDYFNYYVKHLYPEYIRLENFMKENGVGLLVACTLLTGRGYKNKGEFREGKFVFPEANFTDEISCINETFDYMRTHLGNKAWIGGVKMWQAMARLVRQPDFDTANWKKNLVRLSCNFGPRISMEDYYRMVVECYNFKLGAAKRIALSDELSEKLEN